MCLIGLSMLSMPIKAESRSIYIGDLVTLEITTEDVSQEQIIEAFKAFEVVKSSKTKDGVKVTIRTFEPGEKKVTIGNEEIIITVASTLDTIKRDEIYEADLTPRGSKTVIPWLYIYIGVCLVFVISGGILLIRRLRQGKTKSLSPYGRFQLGLERIDSQDKKSLVKMTGVLKLYMEEVFYTRIIGKTSSEIMVEISQIEGTMPYREDIKQWLHSCDTYKFSGISVAPEQIQKMRLDLIQIGACIHEREEVMN